MNFYEVKKYLKEKIFEGVIFFRHLITNYYRNNFGDVFLTKEESLNTFDCMLDSISLI